MPFFGLSSRSRLIVLHSLISILCFVSNDDVFSSGQGTDDPNQFSSTSAQKPPSLDSPPNGSGPCVPQYHNDTATVRQSLQPYPALSRTPCLNGYASVFPCHRVDLESLLPARDLIVAGYEYDESDLYLNDLWGWTDPRTGIEYALVSLDGGLSVVELYDPTSPTLIGFLPTHTVRSGWGDVKTYADHAYVVSEAEGHGMQVLDLKHVVDLADDETPSSNLSEAALLLEETAHYDGFGGTAHNLFIHEDTGFAYVVGAQKDTACSRGGLHVVDLATDPTAPRFAGCYAGDGYTHDVQCVLYRGPDPDHAGREICLASNEDHVTVLDVTDKTQVRMLSIIRYVLAGYTHQGWLTEDQRYFLIDDEADETWIFLKTRTVVADVSDLDHPHIVGEYLGPNSGRAIDHNQYVKGNYVYQANYQAGLRVLDLTHVSQGLLTEKAYFDVYPSSNNADFNGAWSTYPFFHSGTVIISGIEQGLFVVTVDFEDENDNEGNSTDPDNNDDSSKNSVDGCQGCTNSFVANLRGFTKYAERLWV